MPVTRRSWLIVVLGVAVLAAVLAAMLSRPPRLYRATILPSLGGDFTLATAINDRGQIAGFSEVRGHSYHLFLWDRQNGMQDLGPICNRNMDINDKGQIAGAAVDANGVAQAFLWDPNEGMHLLGTHGGSSSEAHAINNRAQIVGAYQISKKEWRAFIWDRSYGMKDLGPADGGFRRAWAINDAGRAIVFAAGGLYLVQVDEQGDVRACTPVPVRGLPAINNAGCVTGVTSTPRGTYDIAVWHADSGLRTLSYPSLEPEMALTNDAGQVVFQQLRRAPLEVFGRTIWRTPRRCYLWDPKRGVIAIHPSVPVGRGEQFYMTDINDKGCIVGALQSTKRGSSRAILLEPIPERPTR